ncbi:hypothetical protein [Nocardia sp. NPDC003979]
MPNDHVCVTPETRDQTWQDNAQGASRRDPVPDCRDEGSLPTDGTIAAQAIRCTSNGYRRATITAFVHDYLLAGADAGSSIKVEHFEAGQWVERPARVITLHNDYSPRRAGETGNQDCPYFPENSGNVGYCSVPPPPKDCRSEDSGSLDCRDYHFGWSTGTLNARSVRSSGYVTFSSGEGLTLPIVSDSY